MAKTWMSKFLVALFYAFKHVFKAIAFTIGIGVLFYAFFGGLAWISDSGTVIGEVLEVCMRGVCIAWLVCLLLMFGTLLVMVFKREVEDDMKKHGWDWDE